MLKELFVREAVKRGAELEGQELRLCGWAHRIRDLGAIRFVVLRDRSGTLQVVFKKGETPQEALSAALGLREEAVICVKGVLRRAPTREGFELLGRELEVHSSPLESLPLEVHDSTKATLPTRLRYRWLDVRNPKVSAVFKLKAWVARKFRDHFSALGFTEIFTPKIVATGTESGADVFPVIYFGKTVYLAQSPQFYKQMAVIAGLERVFEVGPVFRAEPHHTTRHLNEYHSLDIEVGFIESYNDVMDFVEGFFRRIAEESHEVKELLEEHGAEPLRVPERVPRVTMRQAYEILAEYGKKVPYGEDLDPEGERLLGNYAREKHKSDLIFVTEYPWKVRPFYTMRKEEEPQWTYGFDLLMRGLEVVTGGQREHRYERLRQNLREKGLKEDDFEYYLEFFKHGAPPHGGAGMGLERITMQLLGLQNIREARLLPRDTERLTP
ncbi:MAG: aspartate--tRNA(Asn) ligase [Acidilobaceae archaeon]|nr:aspartate--tRNA(Asn) ligase [Acidilobaceae archaeon]